MPCAVFRATGSNTSLLRHRRYAAQRDRVQIRPRRGRLRRHPPRTRYGRRYGQLPYGTDRELLLSPRLVVGELFARRDAASAHLLSHTIYRTNYDDGSHVQYDEVAEYQKCRRHALGQDRLQIRPDEPPRAARARGLRLSERSYPVEGDTWYLGQLDSVVQYEYDGGRFDWVARRAYTYNRYDASERIFCARVWASRSGIPARRFAADRRRPYVRILLQRYHSGLHAAFEEVIEQRAKTTDASCADGRTIITTRIPIPPAARRRPTPTDEPSPSGRSTPNYLPSSVQTMLDRNLLAPARTGRLHRRDRHARRYVPLRSLRASRQPLDAGFARPLARVVPLLEPQLYGRERRLYARHALHRTGVAALRRRRQHLRGAGHGTASDLLSVGLQGVCTSWPKSATPHTTR